MQARLRWLTHLVLAAGVFLRLGLALATPADTAYDNHYEPVAVILNEGRLPDAADCWECFQPPLYYLISAGGCLAAQRAILVFGGGQPDLEHLARGTLQFVSLAAGCATLYVCLLIFHRFPKLAAVEALALAFVAFLPRHIYMSAMATNDAFTYFVASCAVYAVLRAHTANWPTRGGLLAGALCGLTVLSKGYGWVTVFAAWLAVWLLTRERTPAGRTNRWRREIRRPLVLVVCGALALALWPTVRNLRIFHQLHVDNFELKDTPMSYQPPGSVGQTSFFSFRPRALLAHPWVHTSHVDSVWTELYGRLWFDYEGFDTTLGGYPPWEELWRRAGQPDPETWDRARWETLLDYAPSDVPPGFRRVAVASLVAGFPLTLAVLAGCILALRRLGRDFGVTLLWLHFVFALLVPVFQTLRLPHFAAMKAAFALSGLASAPVLVGLLLHALRGKVAGVIVGGVLWLSVLALAAADTAFVVLQFQHFAPPAG